MRKFTKGFILKLKMENYSFDARTHRRRILSDFFNVSGVAVMWWLVVPMAWHRVLMHPIAFVQSWVGVMIKRCDINFLLFHLLKNGTGFFVMRWYEMPSLHLQSIFKAMEYKRRDQRVTQKRWFQMKTISVSARK